MKYFLSTIFVLSYLFAEEVQKIESIEVNDKKSENNLNLKNYMDSDEEHQNEEDKINKLTAEDLKKAGADVVLELVSPLSRIDHEEGIKALLNMQKITAESPFIIADLSLLSGKDLLKTVLNDKKALLLDHVEYSQKKSAYIGFYRFSGDENKNKLLKLKIENIKVKDADGEIGKFLKEIIKNPILKIESVEKIVVKKPVKKTIIVEKKESIFPERETVFVSSSPTIVSSSPGVVVEPIVPGVVVYDSWHHHRWHRW